MNPLLRGVAFGLAICLPFWALVAFVIWAVTR